MYLMCELIARTICILHSSKNTFEIWNVIIGVVLAA
jgi:hypothetical protein